MKLADKVKKLKDGLSVRIHQEATEDKKGAVETHDVMDEDNERILVRNVVQDGEIIESAASEDAQSTEIYADANKTLGRDEEDVVYTAPTQAAAAAYVMEDTDQKSEDREYHDPRGEEAEMGGDTKENKPKESVSEGSTDNSMSEMATEDSANKDMEKEFGSDMEKSTPVCSKACNLLKVFKAKGSIQPEPLGKDKQDEISPRIRTSLDKITKLMRELKSTKATPQSAKVEKPGQWDVLGRRKLSTDTRSKAQKIKDALASQKGTNPYAESGPGGGGGSHQTGGFRRNTSPEKPRPASERFAERVAGKDERVQERKEDSDVENKHNELYSRLFGRDKLELMHWIRANALHRADLPPEQTIRSPGSNRYISYQGQDNKGRHYFSTDSNRNNNYHDFVVSKGANGKTQVQHVPNAVHYAVYGGSRDEESVAKHNLAGHKAAMGSLKHHPKYAELMGKKPAAQSEYHPKDFDKVHTSYKPQTTQGLGGIRDVSVRGKYGGHGYFSFKHNPQENTYSPYGGAENPEKHAAVFENIVKPALAQHHYHKQPGKENPTFKVETAKDKAPHLKVMKSSNQEKANTMKLLDIVRKYMTKKPPQYKPVPLDSETKQALAELTDDPRILEKTEAEAYDADQPDFPNQFIHQEHAHSFMPESALAKADQKMIKSPQDSLKHHRADIQFVNKEIHNKLTKLKVNLDQALRSGKVSRAASQLIKKYGAHINEKDNKLHLRDRHSAFNDVAGSVFSKHSEKFHPRMSFGNEKLNNEAIAPWSLPEVFTCPGAKQCKGYCYARSGPMSWDNASIKRWVNYYSTQRPEFVGEMTELLGTLKRILPVTSKDWEKQIGTVDRKVKGQMKPVPVYGDRVDETGKPLKFNWDTVRIHDAGDFYDQEYANKWAQIINNNKGLNFYAYSKSSNLPHMRQPMGSLESLPNMKMIQSLGGSHDKHVQTDKPHAVIFENMDQAEKAGYANSYNYDRTAANPANKKVGLAIHGKTKGFTLERHLRNAPQLHHLIEGKKVEKADDTLRPGSKNQTANTYHRLRKLRQATKGKDYHADVNRRISQIKPPIKLCKSLRLSSKQVKLNENISVRI